MLEQEINGGSSSGASRPDLGHPEVCGTIPVDGVSAEEAEAIEKLAEIIVDAMMRLRQEHGLTPRQMMDHYAGRREVVKRDGGLQ